MASMSTVYCLQFYLLSLPAKSRSYDSVSSRRKSLAYSRKIL